MELKSFQHKIKSSCGMHKNSYFEKKLKLQYIIMIFFLLLRNITKMNMTLYFLNNSLGIMFFLFEIDAIPGC